MQRITIQRKKKRKERKGGEEKDRSKWKSSPRLIPRLFLRRRSMKLAFERGEFPNEVRLFNRSKTAERKRNILLERKTQGSTFRDVFRAEVAIIREIRPLFCLWIYRRYRPNCIFHKTSERAREEIYTAISGGSAECREVLRNLLDCGETKRSVVRRANGWFYTNGTILWCYKIISYIEKNNQINFIENKSSKRF